MDQFQVRKHVGFRRSPLSAILDPIAIVAMRSPPLAEADALELDRADAVLFMQARRHGHQRPPAVPVPKRVPGPLDARGLQKGPGALDLGKFHLCVRNKHLLLTNVAPLPRNVN